MEDIKWKIPIIHAALSMSNQEIKIFGSAWRFSFIQEF
jgi:hypothetical protein